MDLGSKLIVKVLKCVIAMNHSILDVLVGFVIMMVQKINNF
jgi:hypothetical protein